MENSFDERGLLLQKIKECLRKVEIISTNLKKSNSRYITISLVASALATLLAGLTAVLGPLAGQGASAWRFTCGAVAGFTALAGLMTGLHQRLSIGDRLAKAYACAGRLNALEIALTITKRDPVLVAKEFEEVTASYPDFIL